MFDPIYVRPNANRPNAYVNNIPIGPNDARSIPDRAGEMDRRASDVRGLARSWEVFGKNLADERARATQAQTEYESFKTNFSEKYGVIDSTLRPTDLSGGDEIALSDGAKAYLADLAALEKKREFAERSAKSVVDYDTETRRVLARYEATNQMAAAGWDMRFAPSDGEKTAAWNKFNEMGNRGAMLGAEAEYEHAQRDVRSAAAKAGAAALTEGLEGPALFKVSDDGRIDFDTKGLEHLSPDAQAVEQLKRLVEIMSVRNGLSPLRGAVAKALDIQNAYIAAHPVVAGTVELPF